MKPKRILLLGILSALITTILFYVFMEKTATTNLQTEIKPEMGTVVVAAQDIAKDTPITNEVLKVKEVPVELIHEQAVTDINEVVGTYAITEIKTEEIILMHHVQKKEEETAVVSRKVAEGYRAVSILVDYVTGISNMIQPDDEVDVVLSTVEPKKTEIILERVRVLAVGSRMTEAQSDGTEIAYQSVTLELTQDDMVKVIDASEKGKLQLGLYSKSEPEVEPEEQAQVQQEEETLITVAIKSNIRTAPSLTASVMEIVDQGTTLVFLEQEETETITWYKVKTPTNRIGWISNRIVANE